MLKNEPTDIKKYDGKLYGIYRAVVEENDDSTEWDRGWNAGTGRVRVRVWGVHTKNVIKEDDEGIPVDELPWAEPAYPVLEGSITKIGLWSVPAQGTHVFVFFENGDFMKPKYFACAPGVEPENFQFKSDEGFKDPDGVYPLEDFLGEPDFDYKPIDSDPNPGWMPGRFGNPEYPYNTSVRTRGSHLLELDSTENDRRIHISHGVGSFMAFFEDGDIWEYTNQNKGDIIKQAAHSGYYLAGISICMNAPVVMIGAAVYLGVTCSLSSGIITSGKALATEDHVHDCGGCDGSGNTGLPTDVTSNTFAV